MTKKIVFLDRDGTINIDYGYISNPEQIELFAGVATAIGDLCRSGYLVIIVSNQSAIGRGYATWEQINATNAKLQDLLLAGDPDAKLLMILCSPDAPWDDSSTRKPKIGLIDEVRKKWSFAECDSWMVGDKLSDVEFGLNLGLPQEHCLRIVSADVVTMRNSKCKTVCSLVDAISYILDSSCKDGA